MRTAILLLIGTIVVVSAIRVARPPPLHLKLSEQRRQLSASVKDKAFIQAYEHLSVAAAERETSLADKFAIDLAAHVAAKSAEKMEAEAVAGMTTEVDANSGATVQAELADSTVEAVETEQVIVDSGAADSVSNNGLNIETLQELEYQQSSTNAGSADTETETETEAEAESESEKDKNKKSKSTKAAAGKKVPKAKGVVGKGKAVAKGAKKAAPKKVNLIAKKKVATTLNQAATKWYNCQFSSSPAAGISTLKAVAFRAAPPLRDQAFVVEVDGTYKGPDVTYGSVTLQIARVKSAEPQAKDMPELVYRHSVVLSDVIAFNPFKQSDPLSATMYVPEAAFNMFAPAGEYVATVTFTNQDKLPFGCAKVDFKLE